MRSTEPIRNDDRRSIFRRLTLVGPDEKPFLRRYATPEGSAL